MTRLATVFGVVFFGLVAESGWSAGLEVSPEPGWVSHRVWTPPVSSNATGDYEDLLKDVQVNRVTEETYVRFAYRFLSPKAVQESSSFTIDYDPEFQKVRLHSLTIWHSGVASDQRNISFRSLQREPNLEVALYDANETWVGFLRNVRTGDIVEASYTIEGENPIFQGKYADSYRLQSSYAVQDWYLRIVAREGKTPELRAFETELRPSVQTTKGLTSTEWTQHSVSALRLEANTPPDSRFKARLILSDWTSWSQVVSWALPAYRLRASDEIKALALELTEKCADSSERAQVLLQYVQDQIRYLGVEVGAHSHFPHAPDEVVRNGFGDCKDKAVLYCTLASAVGLDAWPVLVHTSDGERVQTNGPTALAFNHVIAAVSLDGEVRYVDPTQGQQGDLISGQILGPFLYGLELKEGVDRLSPLPGVSQGTRSLIQDFYFENYEGPADVDLVYIYTGYDAVVQRRNWSGMAIDEWKKGLAEQLHDEFGDASLKAGPETSDDRRANTFSVKFSIRVPDLWVSKNGGRVLSLSSRLLGDLLSDPDSVTTRTTPYGLEFPVTVTQTSRLHVPSDWDLKSENELEGPGFRVIDRSRMINPRLIELLVTYSSTAERVAVEQWQDYLAALKKARARAGWSLSYVAPDKSEAVSRTRLGIAALAVMLFAWSGATLGSDF